MMANEMMGKIIQTAIGDLEIIEKLGKGKSGYSYLAKNNEDDVVLKLMHSEPCPYYSFGNSNKVSLEVDAYYQLKECKVLVPKLLSYDIKRNFLVKEFINGSVASELIASNKVSDVVISQLFQYYNLAKSAKLNIDYFPTNFILSNNMLFYIDYECNQYKEKWDLKNWGIYYWANVSGFKEFLRTGNISAINQSLDKGIPIKEPFREKVSQWCKTYDDD